MNMYLVVRCSTILVISGLLAACVTVRPMEVTEDVSAPVALVRPVCDAWSYPNMPADAHWDGQAQLVWTTDLQVLAVDCSLTSISSGWIETLETRVDIRGDRARDLRRFLVLNGVPTVEGVTD
jgi:hypothetical protein